MAQSFEVRVFSLQGFCLFGAFQLPGSIQCNVGALRIRICFWVPLYYTIIIIKTPPKKIIVLVII